MKKLNFQQFEIPTDIAGRRCQTGDAREGFANSIYTRMGGVRAHALAMKIYRSEGPTEYDDREVDLIMEAANQFGVPAFIDGLNRQLHNDTDIN